MAACSHEYLCTLMFMFTLHCCLCKCVFSYKNKLYQALTLKTVIFICKFMQMRPD